VGLRHSLCAIIVGLCLPAGVSAQTRDPENLGFSSERLALIKPWYQAQADAGALTGAVVAIARNGKIAYLEAVGTQDRMKRVPMKTDAIFWIVSMTKPITSVAATMLVDEGKLDLAVPVYRYLPELEDMQVGLERVDAISGATRLVLEPPMRPMTVRDLLQHTSGLVYPEEGNTAIHNRYRGLCGGELDGVRILRPSTVEQMTTPSLSANILFAGVVGGFVGPRWGSSWGLGFAIRTDPNSSIVPGGIGSFTWGGLWGTRFWIDPTEQLAVVQMIQIEPSDDKGQYTRALRQVTYDALRAAR
jgi:CubicO group peptidase (beta-lactamase class C family)